MNEVENDAQPLTLSVSPLQPPADPRLKAVAIDIRQSLYTAHQFLLALPPYTDERDVDLWMWHAALTTLAWDISDVAITVAAESSSLRAARALNRILVEYAARVHLYLNYPHLAELHLDQAPNMLRRVMKPAAANPKNDPNLDAVKALVQSGTTKAKQPTSREMFTALVETFIGDPAERDPYIEFLEAEYALGSAYVHGSQVTFFDLADGNTVHARTRVLHRQAELMRCATAMLVLLAGLERHHKRDFGVEGHVSAVKGLGPFSRVTSVGTHDTLGLLLGIGSG